MQETGQVNSIERPIHPAGIPPAKSESKVLYNEKSMLTNASKPLTNSAAPVIAAKDNQKTKVRKRTYAWVLTNLIAQNTGLITSVFIKHDLRGLILQNITAGLCTVSTIMLAVDFCLAWRKERPATGKPCDGWILLTHLYNMFTNISMFIFKIYGALNHFPPHMLMITNILFGASILIILGWTCKLYKSYKCSTSNTTV